MSATAEARARRAKVQRLRQAERQQILRAAVRQVGSQAALAELVVRDTRTVERWLASYAPSPIPVVAIARILQEYPALEVSVNQ